MKEQALRFGDGLSGVLCAPATPAREPGFVLLNAGILHRVGFNRFHVRLARALGQAGIASVRFDLSGIGESGPRGDGLDYDQSVLQEAREAMDLLSERCGVRRFALFGLCSGADNAVRIATAEKRVIGAVLLQAYSFTSRGYELRYFARRLRQARTWRRLAAGSLELPDAGRRLWHAFKRRPAAAEKAMDESRFWRMPPVERIVQDFAALLERRVELLLVYSRPSPGEHNYRSILAPVLRAAGPAATSQVEIFTGSDHTFSPLSHQERLLARVLRWAQPLHSGPALAERAS